MAQQTAVKWLEDRLNNVKPTQFCSIETIKEWVEQAKQMEKEQIMKAVYDSMGTNFDPNGGRAEQYYNETYNK